MVRLSRGAGSTSIAKRSDLRFRISGGKGISRYLGLNFAPDTVYASSFVPIGANASA